MLNPSLLLYALILFVLTPAVTSGAQQEAPETAASSARSHVNPTSESQARAKELYGIDCAMCHGERGNGQSDLAKDMQLKLDDWTDPKSLADKTDAVLFKSIRNGKDKMPPEAEGRAKDDEVWNLIIYIRSLSKSQSASSSKP